MKNKKVIIITLILVLLLIGSTYAWFIFHTDVDVSLEAKVKSWKIEFKEDDEILDTEMAIEIASIYPGMEEYTKSISIQNKGEIDASVGYKISAIELFGERKSVGENCTEEELNEYIASLPFVIDFELDKETVVASGDEANYNITVNWPLGDISDTITEKDEIDTQMGIKAYEFNSLPENQDTKNLSIEVKLYAVQKNN